VVPKVALSTDLNRNNWQHLDPINDSVPGMIVDKTYKEIEFSELSKSGKMVNLYNALIYAAKKEYK